jgi:mono/diheme cytochrome c family protein
MTTRKIALFLFAVLAVVVVAGGCQPGDERGTEYMPDMAYSQSYKAFQPNEAMRNGITLQKPVANTIARGYHPFHYGKGEAEAVRAGTELTNPFHPTEPTLARGKALFQIYCLVCHGEQGKGDGPISSKIPPPPSYKSDRLLGYAPGRFFHVITMGANKMPSYATQIAPADRWLIITYIRAQLQGLPEAPPGANPPMEVDATGSEAIPSPSTPGAGGTR